MKEILDIIDSKVNDNDTLIIACSTGSDSMCLLSLVQKLSKKVRIICAHVNHNVRKQSLEEYSYLEDYCKNNNIIFEGMTITEKIDNNFEDTARKIRYKFFNDLYKKYNAKYILTAHHGDDLIETILMRITRGSNLKGYSGIKMEDGKYLRPLLLTNKDSILEYLKENNIKYYEDYTNNEDEHTRNRYRHNVLPFLKSESNDINRKYLKFSKELQLYDNFVNEYIKKNKFIKNNSFDLSLSKEDYLIQKKVIELIISKLQEDYIFNINDSIVDNIIKLMHSKKSNLYIDLIDGFIARKDYNVVTIEKKKDNISFNVAFNDFFENDEYIIRKVNTIEGKSNYIIRLDSKEITLPLIIRTKEDSDKMIVKNLGTKKIKDIFINEKVSINKRNSYPIVCDSSNNILWLPGLKKSKFDKDKKEKYDIILLCERKNVNEKC